MVLIGLAAMLLVAKLGGELFERLKQPAVLGELIGGILVGNLVLLGFTAAEPLKTDAGHRRPGAVRSHSVVV
jgi:Kef-type K+ transport system membrane component KefB